ncbi:hypothetical protein C5S36_03630 [Candidatus Methanophagaceae archaeon]|nr:hypothetical protein C5S36_03630 [Methanophagales archaeon]
MKKQIVMATVVIMLTAVLLAPPVMASAGDKTIDVGGKQLKLVEHKEDNIGDIIERGHVQSSISGHVDHGVDAYRCYLSATMRVEITIDHTPTAVTGVLLGVCDDDLIYCDWIIDNDQDGHAHFPDSGTCIIPENGYYRIVVGAYDGGFSYEGWYDIYW